MSPKKTKVLIFIVTYNAASHIEAVLDRIPQSLWDQSLYDTEILLIDDASSDATVRLSNLYAHTNNRPLTVLKNPVNQGYGGNQKIGYTYAIEKGFDIVALLHGDGQYAPEYLVSLIAPIAEGSADAVFGSRMIHKREALRGGMPLYKFVGNILLTSIQNLLLRAALSEFHSGYRVYSVDALKKLPFPYNANGFDFDTDIIIQLFDNGFKVKELPIPTFYGDEICYVNGLAYAWKIVRSTFLSRVQRFYIYYDPKFDYARPGESPYTPKLDFDSSHRFAIECVPEGATVLDIGCGEGYIAKALKEKGCTVYGIDQYKSADAKEYCKDVYVMNLDSADFHMLKGKKFEYVLLLDVIEHLKQPEHFMALLKNQLEGQPRIVMTTGNIAFITFRLSLLLGQFNYGKKGILDLTHTRLFTFASLKRLLEMEGYKVEKVEGIPVPLPLVIPFKPLARFAMWANKVLITCSKALFSYQIAIQATPTPTLSKLLWEAEQTGEKARQEVSIAYESDTVR